MLKFEIQFEKKENIIETAGPNKRCFINYTTGFTWIIVDQK